MKSYRDHNGKSTTKVVEKFGTVEGLREQLHGEEPIVWAQRQVDEMTAADKAGREEIHITLKPLEKKLKENFGISRVVVCTDCGLSSYENHRNDSTSKRN